MLRKHNNQIPDTSCHCLRSAIRKPLKRPVVQLPATDAEPISGLLHDQYCWYELPKEGFLPDYVGFYPLQAPRIIDAKIRLYITLEWRF
ncbi:MAG: hypothetical protein U0936_21690 [Planctomycetaceae bacterium]